MKGPTPIISSMLADVAPNSPMPRMSREGSVSGKALRYHTAALSAMMLVWLFLCEALAAQSPLQQAVELTRKGQYAEAEKLLVGISAPAPLPQRIAFYRLKAAISSGLKQPKLAAQEMEQALAFAPSDYGLLRATAVAELAAGFLDAAEAHARASAPDAVRDALVGEIEEQRGHFEAAARAYESAVRLAPSEEHYRLALGVNLIRRQQYEKAIQMLKTALPAFPKSAKLRTLLGIAQYANGYPDVAIISLNEAIAVDVSAEPAYAALAKIVLQSSAVPIGTTMISLCRWNGMICSALQLREARAAGDEKLLAQATETLKLSSESDPVGRCELARAYEWQGNWGSAKTELERCVRLDPSPQNHYRLGLLYKRMGLTELAEREMSSRQELLKSMSEETALSLNLLEEKKTASSQ